MAVMVIVKAYWEALRSAASKAFWRVFFPFLLFAQVVVPVYLIDIRLVMSLMASSDNDGWALYDMPETASMALAAAVTVAGLSVIFLLLWAIPLGFCLWSYYWVAARWTPIPAPESPTMQVDGKRRRRRYCNRCKIFRGDRTYHCRAQDKCLPLYDHTCYWWTGAIWLHNIRAYLLFIFFLPVYQAYILGISLWVTISPKKYWHANAYISLGIPSGITLYVSGYVLYMYTQQLVVWNILHHELDHGIWYLTAEGDLRFWDPKKDHPSSNPWNQGWRINLQAIFSRRLKDTIECSSQRDTPIPLRPLEVTSRRANCASTGFEDDIELGNLVRRSRSTA